MSESLKAMRELLHTRMLDNEPMDELDELRELQRDAVVSWLKRRRGAPPLISQLAELDAMLDEVEP